MRDAALQAEVREIFAMDDDALRRHIEKAVVTAKMEHDGKPLGFVLGVLASQPQHMPSGSMRRAIFDEGVTQLSAHHPDVIQVLADQVDAQAEALRRVGVPVKGPNLYREWLRKHALQPDKRPGMDFGAAIRAAREGKKIKRAGWNGKDQFVVFMPGMTLSADQVNERTRAHVGEGCQLVVGGYFVIARPGAISHEDGRTTTMAWQPGWLASQADMLAEDWEIVTYG